MDAYNIIIIRFTRVFRPDSLRYHSAHHATLSSPERNFGLCTAPPHHPLLFKRHLRSRGTQSIRFMYVWALYICACLGRLKYDDEDENVWNGRLSITINNVQLRLRTTNHLIVYNHNNMYRYGNRFVDLVWICFFQSRSSP